MAMTRLVGWLTLILVLGCTSHDPEAATRWAQEMKAAEPEWKAMEICPREVSLARYDGPQGGVCYVQYSNMEQFVAGVGAELRPVGSAVRNNCRTPCRTGLD